MFDFARKTIGELQCVIAAPEGADFSTDSPDAMMVCCHGFGASGTDLVPCSAEMYAAHTGLGRVVFVFPAAPIELDPLFESRAWWPIDIEKIQKLQMTGEFRELRSEVPEQLATCRQMIFDVIDHCRTEFRLPANKVIVGGFSQGAMLTTDVALNYDELVGGLVAWSGSLINEQNWITAANAKSTLNVFQSHGKTDPILPFLGAEALRKMLANQGHDVDFLPFAGQHQIPSEALEGAADLIAKVAAS